MLLLFTRLPGALYFTLDWESAFFTAGKLEEGLNSLLKLQVVESQKAKKGETGKRGVQGKSKVWGHQHTRQSRNQKNNNNIYCTVTEKHAGSRGAVEHHL